MITLGNGAPGGFLSGGVLLQQEALSKTLGDLCPSLPPPSQRLVKDNKNKPEITKTLIRDSRASKI